MARKTKPVKKEKKDRKDKKDKKDKNDAENSVAPKSNYDGIIREGLSQMKLSVGTLLKYLKLRQKIYRFHKTET